MITYFVTDLSTQLLNSCSPEKHPLGYLSQISIQLIVCKKMENWILRITLVGAKLLQIWAHGTLCSIKLIKSVQKKSVSV